MLGLASASCICGWISVFCWLCAQLPQIKENYQTKSVAGLSALFLFNWLIGDIANIAGCLLTHQLPFQTALAAYFVLLDLGLCCQYLQYRQPDTMHELFPSIEIPQDEDSTDSNNDGKKKAVENLVESMEKDNENSKFFSDNSSSEPSTSYSSSSSSVIPRSGSATTTIVGATALSGLSNALPIFMRSAATASSKGEAMPLISMLPTEDIVLELSDLSSHGIGVKLSWICTFLYMISRMPQIYKNHIRKSTDGVSVALFSAALLGNSFYAASILTSPTLWTFLDPQVHHGLDISKQFLWEELPFLMGALSTMSFDIVILTQHIIYSRFEPQPHSMIVIEGSQPPPQQQPESCGTSQHHNGKKTYDTTSLLDGHRDDFRYT